MAYPKNVAVERLYQITYVTGTCQCENCHKTKQVMALSHQDAWHDFMTKFPLAQVVKIDRIG